MTSTVIGCQSQSTGYRLTVEAGYVDRNQSVASFDLPEELQDRPLVLRAMGREPLPVQVHDGKGWFILDRLEVGESVTFSIEIGPETTYPAIGVSEDNSGVTFSHSGDVILRYNGPESPMPREGIDPIFKRGGYIHPVYTPSSTLISNDYPANHLHHHGIWGAWTNTAFQGRKPDFWNMGDSTGTVLAKGIDEVWAGQVLSGFKSRHAYVDLSATPAVTALNESWETRIYAVENARKPYYLFDLIVRQTTATDSALTLPEYRYGGVGFRGHDEWEGADHAYFLTSEGKDRSNGHATHARWCHIGGYVAGQLAGVAILAHPDNFRAPEPMRIHPTEPFFNWAPSQDGDWAITPDQPFEATYRFVVMDGPPDPASIDRLWDDFAHPVKTTVARN